MLAGIVQGSLLNMVQSHIYYVENAHRSTAQLRDGSFLVGGSQAFLREQNGTFDAEILDSFHCPSFHVPLFF